MLKKLAFLGFSGQLSLYELDIFWMIQVLYFLWLAYSKSLDYGYYCHFVRDIWNLCLDLDESFEILAQKLFDLLLAIEHIYVCEASWLESLEVNK
jgi:hypothetical protein